MRKELFKIEDQISSVTISDKNVASDVTFILQSGKKISITTHHSQDCCESVYADFTVLEYFKEAISGKSFSSASIIGVEEIGFLLVFNGGYEKEILRI